MKGGWIGVDLDGTLATYDHWRGVRHIGEPVGPMVERVKAWRAEGREVRIMTARVGIHAARRGELGIAEQTIQAWCKEHLGEVLEVTCVKDLTMSELWDDRAVRVEKNTGRQLSPSEGNPNHGAAGRAWEEEWGPSGS